MAKTDMKNPQAIALGAAILVAGTGGLATSQSMPAPSMAPASSDPALSPLTDDGFVQVVQRSNDSEIAAARYVLKSTKNAAVREFATRMVQDHSTAEVSLQTTSRNAHVALPQRGRAMVMAPPAFRNATGPSLDYEYFQQQVAAHTDALNFLTAYAANGKNPILRMYANMQVTVVQSHLDLAQNDLTMMANMPGMSAAMKPNAGASVAPIPQGGNEGASSQNGGQIAPNPSASPIASASSSSSSSPNPQPSIGVPNTPGPRVSASPSR